MTGPKYPVPIMVSGPYATIFGYLDPKACVVMCVCVICTPPDSDNLPLTNLGADDGVGSAGQPWPS